MASKSTAEKENQALLSKLKTTLGPETYTEFQKKLKASPHYLSTTFECRGKEKLLEEVGSFLPANVGEEVRSLQNKRKREERGTVMLGGWKVGVTPVKKAVRGFDPLFGLSTVKISPRPKSLLDTPTKGPPETICLKPESLPSSSPSSSSSKSPTLSSKTTSLSSSKVCSSSLETSSPSKSSPIYSKVVHSPSPSPSPSSSKSSPASDRSKQTSSSTSKPKPAPAPTKRTPKPKPIPASAPTSTFLPTLDLSPSLYLFDPPKPNPDPFSSSSDDDDDNDPANTIKCSFCLEEIDEATAPKCGHVGCPTCWAKEFGAKKVMYCPLCKKKIFRHQLQPLFFG